MTLEAENLKKAFGGLRAVDGVSFTASTGAITCITGPNGAGKTTVFNMLTGFSAPDEGRILLDGRDITALPPAARARAGIARTFQTIRLLDDISALDNLITALHGEMNGRLADTLLPTPRLMLMDEPASGLNTQEAYELGGMINRLDRERMIIIVIEHNMALVGQIAGRVIHIDGGRLMYELERKDWLSRMGEGRRA